MTRWKSCWSKGGLCKWRRCCQITRWCGPAMVQENNPMDDRIWKCVQERRILTRVWEFILQRTLCFFLIVFIFGGRIMHGFNVGLYRCSRVVRNGYNDLKTPWESQKARPTEGIFLPPHCPVTEYWKGNKIIIITRKGERTLFSRTVSRAVFRKPYNNVRFSHSWNIHLSISYYIWYYNLCTSSRLYFY